MVSLSVATVVTITSATAGVVAGILSALLARGPGWEYLRWYSLAAFAAGVFALTDAVLTSDGTDELVMLAARVNLCSAGLHGACWFPFFAAWEKRSLRPVERAFVATAVAGALFSLLPGVFAGPPILRRHLASLGITYHDPQLTPLGAAFASFCLVGMVALAVKALRLSAREPRAWYLGVGFALLTAAIVNDLLAATRVIRTPYVVDLALLALPILVGVTVSGRVAKDARLLEETVRRLAATQTELVRKERLAALGELAGVVAHEVRNPLGVIYNVLSSLRRGSGGSPETGQLLSIAEEEAERLRRMVSALLEFVRPCEPHPTTQDVSGLLHGAREAAVAVTSRGIESEVLFEPSQVEQVECDGELLQQALMHLLVNALEAPGRSAPVRVTVRRDGGLVRLAVHDDGQAVEESRRKRLFAPSFSAGAAGTGLGLALVKRAAEAHGGEVFYEPAPAGGSSFTLVIPQRPAREGPRGAQAESS